MGSLLMAMQRVRIRIRSWKDIVLIIVIAVIYVGIQQLLQKVFNLDEKKASTIAAILSVIIAIIGVFAVGD